MLNKTKNYTYLRRRKPPLVEQCLNYFLEYGKGETADNTGDIYKLSMSNIFYAAKASDEARVGQKDKKPAEEDGYEEDGYEDGDYDEDLDDEDLDGDEIDDDEIEALIREHG